VRWLLYSGVFDVDGRLYGVWRDEQRRVTARVRQLAGVCGSGMSPSIAFNLPVALMYFTI
jgi:hypothetical protein